MTKKRLTHLNILITRPIPHNQSLGEAIKNLGGSPIAIPSVEIKPLTFSFPLPTQDDIVIFVSAHAVENSKKFLNALHKIPSPKLLAIGPKTAKAIEAQHLPVSGLPETYNSESLLKRPELQNVANKRIYLVSGKNTRPLLTQTLSKRHAILVPLVCYRRHPLALTPKQIEMLKSIPIHVVVTTSPAILSAWHKMIIDAQLPCLLNIPTIVIDEKQATLARTLKFNNVIVSKNATNECIIDTLLKGV